jgi:LPS export ABC transporter protein LptC
MKYLYSSIVGIVLIYLSCLFIFLPSSYSTPTATAIYSVQVDDLILKEYRNGNCQRSIQAQHLNMNESDKMIYLDKPEFTVFSQSSTPQSILTAEKSQINLRNNLIIITGNILLKLQNNTQFKTSKLFWDTAKKKFYTNVAVTIIKDNNLLQGENFEADENFDHIQVGRFSAKRGKI